MRLVSFDGGFGRVEGDALIPMGDDILDYLRSGQTRDHSPVALSTVRLTAPLPRPGKIICVGLNYRDHAAETGTPLPPQPPLFAKFSNSVLPDGGVIVLPHETTMGDYEVELGAVIGRTTRRVAVEDALAHVAGYITLNDVSARDLQAETGQWTRGKAIDTFLPCGPWLTTADEIPDPQALRIRAWVNGDLRQDSSTREMSWGVADLVSIISQTMTLGPGDLIATGTPAGVGAGRRPPRYLVDGDLVEMEIESVGRLSNLVQAERAPAASAAG
jgi:2-keto-4-pentenoate hydratase/2-oxohepta-3-ene-1,7-dioic acid hydratase in catechol pathway